MLKIFASFVLFAGGDGGSVCHIEGSVVGIGDTMPPSSCPGLMRGQKTKIERNVGKFGLLSIVGLSPAKETMVEGANGEGQEEERDGV